MAKCKNIALGKMADHPEYEVWRDMKKRCYQPSKTGYEYWGGRGIVVCDRWLNSFWNFLADMGSRPNGKYTLERRDVNGNYAPENCYWLLKVEQPRNRTNNIWLEYNGRKMLQVDWLREFGLKRSTNIKRQLDQGISFNEIAEKYYKKEFESLYIFSDSYSLFSSINT